MDLLLCYIRGTSIDVKWEFSRHFAKDNCQSNLQFFLILNFKSFRNTQYKSNSHYYNSVYDKKEHELECESTKEFISLELPKDYRIIMVYYMWIIQHVFLIISIVASRF
jgi:hypothetical protein